MTSLPVERRAKVNSLPNMVIRGSGDLDLALQHCERIRGLIELFREQLHLITADQREELLARIARYRDDLARREAEIVAFTVELIQV